MPILGYTTITAQERGATSSSGRGGAARVQGKAGPECCEAVQRQLGAAVVAGLEQSPPWPAGR